MTLRVAMVVPEIGHEASGPSYSVPRLSSSLAARDVSVTLHVLRWLTTPEVPGVETIVYPRLPGPRVLGLSTSFRRGIREAARHVHLVHNNGLWMLPNVHAGLAARAARTPLVTSPRGVFAPWAMNRSKRTKRIMWLLGQGSSVRSTALFHATSEAELADIRRLGFKAPVAIIPNGIDLPPSASRDAQGAGPRVLLFLGRIHPVKGVDLLLHCWQRVAKELPDWELHIVGPEDANAVSMRALSHELALQRVRFLGPRFGAAKFLTYANAELYILPTHTENFGMTIAESLACGTPVITTRGAPWPRLEVEGCGRWVERTGSELDRAVLELARATRAELQAMGLRGRAWMEREYSWASISERMEAAYSWLLGGGPRPRDIVIS
ncbi:MAG: glycosyltransferase [Myxococcales bacterium]|nr:glycosyltransferase [Myxococcales bacterium]